jgi:hypothetical protein
MKTILLSIICVILLTTNSLFAQHYIDAELIASTKQQAQVKNGRAEWGRPRLDTPTLSSIKNKGVYFSGGNSFEMEGYDLSVAFNQMTYRGGDKMRLIIKASAPKTENITISVFTSEFTFSKEILGESNKEYVIEVPIPKTFSLDSIYGGFSFGVGASKPTGRNDNNPLILFPGIGLSYNVFLIDKMELKAALRPSENVTPLYRMNEVKTDQVMPGTIPCRIAGHRLTAKEVLVKHEETGNLSLNKDKDENKVNKITSNHLETPTSTPMTPVTISGSWQFANKFRNNLLLPIPRWTLIIYEANTEQDVNNRVNGIETEYRVASVNGSFSVQTNVSRSWYRIELRFKGARGSNTGYYECAKFESFNGTQISSSTFFRATTAISNNGLNINLSPTIENGSPDDIDIEIYRSLAYLSYRIDSMASYASSTLGLRVSNSLGGNLSIDESQKLLALTKSGLDGDRLGEAFATTLAAPQSSVLVLGTLIRLQNQNEDNYYNSNSTLFHEFGHILQFSLNNFFFYPEQSGVHFIDGRGNPNNAFSEGWANFWACVVRNNSLYEYFSLNLATTDLSFIDNQPNVTPSSPALPVKTRFDGPDNEAMVACALWQMSASNGITSVWNGMASNFQAPSPAAPRKPRNIMEYFAANSSLSNSFYTSTRALATGFGNGFAYISSNANLQGQINSLTATRPLIYIGSGTYEVSPILNLGTTTVGIYGMGPRDTFIRGQGFGNVIQVGNRPSNTDWLKLSDLQVTNGNFGIDAGFDGVGATGQPRVFVQRCIVSSNQRGMCFAGDAVVRNSVIKYGGTGVGIMSIASGEANRQIYIYNNVLENCNPAFLFRNNVPISGRISNNIIVLPPVSSSIVAEANPTSGIRASSTGIMLELNGLTSNPAGGIVTVGSNQVGTPNFVSGNFYNPANTAYPDGGINFSPTYDPIFYDRATGERSGNNGTGTYTYGDLRNWIGIYGGQTAFFGGSFYLPASAAEPVPISYAINEHDVWGGFVEVIDSNVTVSAGARLTILPNTTVSLAPGKQIIVEPGGKLIANGTGDLPIVFKRYDSGQSWQSILINADSCQFSHCTFDGGYNNVEIQSRGTAFSNCVFKNAYTGNISYWTPSGDRPSFSLNGCLFQNNRVGIIVSYGDATITNTLAINNTSVGLYLWNANAAMTNSTVSNNVTDVVYEGNRGGIELRSSSMLDISSGAFNRVWDNRSHEIRIDQYGMVVAKQGYNSIRDYVNGYGSDDQYIRSETFGEPNVSETVNAVGNWWGADPPRARMFFGSVNYSEPLGADPTLDSQPRPIIASLQATDGHKNVSSESLGELETARIKQIPIRWRELQIEIQRCLATLNESSTQLVGLNALKTLYRAIRQDRFNQTRMQTLVDSAMAWNANRLRRYVRGSNSGETEMAITLGGESALLYQISTDLQRRNFAAAQARLVSVEPLILNKDNKAVWLMQKLHIEEQSRQYANALTTLGRLEALVPEPNGNYQPLSYREVREQLTRMMTGTNAVEKTAISSVRTVTTEKPMVFGLSQNYPNPFNPATSITYQLPFRSNVRLEVFDILGRRVVTLINDIQQAGSYTLPFNAAQASLASGMYFYRLQAGSFVQTKKMLLVK